MAAVHAISTAPVIGMGEVALHKSRSDVRRRRTDLLAAAALLGLAGCGGDDAGPDPIANRPPAFSSATTATVIENTGGSFYRAAASDPEGNTLSYSIAGGADAARFTITTGGELAFRDPPNFERATDADGDNVYRLDIAVSDGTTSVTQPLAVTVTNSKEGVAVTRIANGFVDPVTISDASTGVILVGERDGSVYRVDTRTGSRELHARVGEGRNITLISVSAVQTFRLNGTFMAMFTDGEGLYVSRYARDIFGNDFVPDPIDILYARVSGYEGGWLGRDAQGNMLLATGDDNQRVNPTLSAQDDSSPLGSGPIDVRVAI